MGKMIDHILNVRKYDTVKNWTLNNPILAKGQISVTDTGKFKVGDGVTPWVKLPYSIDSGETSYIDIAPYIDIDDKYVKYNQCIGAYYKSEDYVNLHFIIDASIDTSELDPLTPLNIVLENAPEFNCSELADTDLGSIILMGFGNVNDATVRGIENTNKLQLMIRASAQTDYYNDEFMATVKMSDVPSNKRIIINGVISYFTGNDFNIINLDNTNVNVPDEVKVHDISKLAYRKLDTCVCMQIYLVLSPDDYDDITSENNIVITIPDDIPEVDSSILRYISGTIHPIGIDLVDPKLVTFDGSRELTVYTKSYEGTEKIIPAKYKDIFQETAVLSGTFIYSIEQ